MQRIVLENDIELYDIFNSHDLDDLINSSTSPCVSLYLPMQRAGKEVRQNSIRFKNGMEQVRSMVAQLMGNRADEKLDLKRAMKLYNETLFWNSQDDGLALFLSLEISKIYRLPLQFKETIVVGDRFHVKPVLPLIAYEADFFVLALSQNECRLYHCSRQQWRMVSPKGMPENLAESMRYDLQEKQLQFHTGTPATSGQGKRGAMFHGHGVANDEDKDRIVRYFQDINRAVTAFLGSKTSPLILMGVDFLHQLYKTTNTYPYLIQEGIMGNPENLTGAQLHDKAWEIMQPRSRKDIQKALKQYHDLKGTGKTGKDIRQILQAATVGRIDKLIIPVDVELWGSYNESREEVVVYSESRPQPGYEDLLNTVAYYAMKNGGATVMPVDLTEMPDDALVAAVFRY
jgi:hypothetical protein